MQNKVAIGKITKVVGLRGEVKVISLTDFPNVRFKKNKEVELYHEETNQTFLTTIEKVRLHRGAFILKFTNLETIESVEPYLNYLLLIEKDHVVEKDGAFYFDELISCRVVNELNEELGVVVKVEDYPAHHTLRVQKEDQKTFLIPFVNFFIKEVDLKKKIITIHEIEGLI